MHPHQRNKGGLGGLIFLIVVVAFIWSSRTKNRPSAPPRFSTSSSSTPRANPPSRQAATPRRNGPTTSPTAVATISKLIQPPANLTRKDGIAAAILVDTSGSMAGTVRDADGRQRKKLEIAQRCVLSVVRQAEQFAKESPDEPLLLGIYEFSGRGGSMCRKVLPFAVPNAATAEAALRKISSSGGTPIGQAIIDAKRDLDATALSRLHILVVTDGENTVGHAPGDTVYALSRLPDEGRPGIYFIAFDVAANVFDSSKDAGALVLSASNETELKKTLEFLMSSKILLEQ